MSCDKVWWVVMCYELWWDVTRCDELWRVSGGFLMTFRWLYDEFLSYFYLLTFTFVNLFMMLIMLLHRYCCFFFIFTGCVSKSWLWKISSLWKFITIFYDTNSYSFPLVKKFLMFFLIYLTSLFHLDHASFLTIYRWRLILIW